MAVWTPPGYLTLDALFCRIGSEIFGTQWTGNESLAGHVQPPEYWLAQELERKAAARQRKAHSEAAARAAVSIGGSPMGKSSSNRAQRNPIKPRSTSEGPDWRSEAYAKTYKEDQEALARYRDVARKIIETCWHGKYQALYQQPDGQFLVVDATAILSEAFQSMISNPSAPNREKIFLMMHDGSHSIVRESQSPRRRGRSPKQSDRVKAEMLSDIRSGNRNPQKMLQKEWEDTYRASRDTCKKALATALSEIQAGNSDK